MFSQSHQVVLPNAAIASRTFNKIAAALPAAAACSAAFTQSRFSTSHRHHRKRLPNTTKIHDEPTTFTSSSSTSCMLPSSTKVAAAADPVSDAKALLRTLVDDVIHLASGKHATAKTIRRTAFAIETKLQNCVSSVLSHFAAEVSASSSSSNTSRSDINQPLLLTSTTSNNPIATQQFYTATATRPAAVVRHLANTLNDLNSNISSPLMPSSSLSSSLLLATAFRQNCFSVRGFKSRTSTGVGRLQSTSLKQQQQAADSERHQHQATFAEKFISKLLVSPTSTSPAARNPFLTELLGAIQQQQNKPMVTRQSAAAAAAATSSAEGALIDNTVREKYMKGDPRLSEEEQNRTKLAFLEGFVNAKQYNTKLTTADGVAVAAATPPNRAKAFIDALRSLLMFMLTVGVIYLMLTLLSNMGSMKQLMGMSQHEALAEDVDATFEDVRGCDEAKDELREIVEYLKNPDRFSALGGRLPKGVLLIGPPGTGKTLLGRAVAGEAGVPFFHVAGSEFDEILVGQGARRVRDLFMSAKEKAPCVIFIDEIDAVGSKRTSSVIHPHANQTINQLLAEMDGFHQNEGVIVLGATNRREDLDKALTRPGRFDIEVHVPVPDLKGRLDIINYYLAKIRIAANVNADVLARGTTGFTGADLESMINQSALKAASDNCSDVGMEYIEHARDKVLMGPAKKSRIPDEEVNKMTAFHEAGHTLVAYFTEYAMPLHKVTIIPRGMSLGHTACLPEKENYSTTRAQMLASLDTLMGGRAAEELIFGEKFVTSGAADDLRKASELVRHMVKQYGFSDKVGLRFFRTEDNSGSSIITTPDMSPATQDVIDQEIRRLLQESYERAKGLLVKYAKEHKALAEALLHHETLDAAQVKLIMEGKHANMPKSKRIL